MLCWLIVTQYSQMCISLRKAEFPYRSGRMLERVIQASTLQELIKGTIFQMKKNPTPCWIAMSWSILYCKQNHR
jgi:hypothetical protein